MTAHNCGALDSTDQFFPLIYCCEGIFLRHTLRAYEQTYKAQYKEYRLVVKKKMYFSSDGVTQ